MKVTWQPFGGGGTRVGTERAQRSRTSAGDSTRWPGPETTRCSATVFAPAKDRPVLFTAAGWSDVLLTLDRQHFGQFYTAGFYSLRVSPPDDFLVTERNAGRLLPP